MPYAAPQVARFYSPTVARGRIYVASDKLHVFQIGGGSTGVGSAMLQDNVSVAVASAPAAATSPPSPSSADTLRGSTACLLAMASFCIICVAA